MSEAPVVDYAMAAYVVVLLVKGLWTRWSNATLPGLTQVRLSPAGLCQVNDPLRADDAGLTPWDSVTKVLVEPRGEDRTRIQIVCKTPWWKPTIIPVDAEVVAGPARAEAIRGRIEEWRRDSAAGARAAAPCPRPAGV